MRCCGIESVVTGRGPLEAPILYRIGVSGFKVRFGIAKIGDFEDRIIGIMRSRPIVLYEGLQMVSPSVVKASTILLQPVHLLSVVAACLRLFILGPRVRRIGQQVDEC